MKENLGHFFNNDEFADSASFSNGLVTSVIFDQQYMKTSGPMGMENASPAILMPTASVPENVIGMTVTVVGMTYEVAEKEREPDGDPALTVLYLDEAF